MLKKLRENHRGLWTRDMIQSAIYGLGLFIVAMIIQGMADKYVLRVAGNSVDDLFLSHLPAVDIDGFIILGALLITFLAFCLMLFKPKYFNFGLKSISLFVIIRSFLISLTHLGPNPNEIVFDTTNIGFSLYNILYHTKNDFFFSGHTGIPFLLALIFWPERGWRSFFVVSSVLFGIGVLLAHIHYSIDVFAAPLITYSIFSISKKLFHSDYRGSLKGRVQ